MEILIFDSHRRLSAIISSCKCTQHHFSESTSKNWFCQSNLEEQRKIYVNPSRNLLTRITDRRIPCVYTHAYHVIKNRGPGPYNSLRHADNRKYFSGLSLTRNRREAHMFYLAREVVKTWRCSCWEKGNFIMINEFKYGQTWKMWPSPLSLSLYSTFKETWTTALMSFLCLYC